MSGRRPDRTQVWNFIDSFREPQSGLNWTSLPEFFKKAGYLSLGAGKMVIFPNPYPNPNPNPFPFVLVPSRCSRGKVI